jgi:hypothetical protein
VILHHVVAHISSRPMNEREPDRTDSEKRAPAERLEARISIRESLIHQEAQTREAHEETLASEEADIQRHRRELEEVLGQPVDEEQWRRRTRSELLYKILDQNLKIYGQQAKIEEQARKIKSLEPELSSLESRVEREQRAQQPVHEDRKKATTIGPKRKHLNRVVIFEVHATIEPEAEGTFQAARQRYGPSAARRSEKFKITHGDAVGQALRLRFEYVVRGGYPADIRRALNTCLEDASATLAGEPSIEVISRERLPEHGAEDQAVT